MKTFAKLRSKILGLENHHAPKPSAEGPSQSQIQIFTTLLQTEDNGWLCPQCKIVKHLQEDDGDDDFDLLRDVGFEFICGRADLLRWAYNKCSPIDAFEESYKDAAEDRTVAYFVNPAWIFVCLNQVCKNAHCAKDCIHKHCRLQNFDRTDGDSEDPVHRRYRPRESAKAKWGSDLNDRLFEITKGKWPCPRCCVSEKSFEELKKQTKLGADELQYKNRLENAIASGEMKLQKKMWQLNYPVYVWRNKWNDASSGERCGNKVTESGTKCDWPWGYGFKFVQNGEAGCRKQLWVEPCAGTGYERLKDEPK